MPESTTPDAELDAGPGDDVNVVHVIQSSYHYRDQDNYPKSDDAIMDDEGWFADAGAAAIRCEKLNAQNRVLYDSTMATRKRERDAKIQKAEQHNLEAGVLRAAGIPKDDVAVPTAFVAPPFETYSPDHPHTSYEVMEIRRSDHDGIARAAVLIEPASDD